MGWYDQNIGPILGSRWNLRNNPKSKPILGLCQAPRVQIWVQPGSCWPLGSEISSDFKVSSCFGYIQSNMIGKKIFKNNYAVIDPM